MPASTNRVSLAAVAETVYGVTPSGPPSLAEIRFTGESLKQTTNTGRSAEIRADRQISNVFRSGVGADGDINFALYFGNSLDTFVSHALQSPTKIVAANTGSITCSLVAATGTFTASSGTPFSILAAGEIVKFTGFVNAANNGYFRVASIGGSGLSVVVDQIGALVNETSVAGVVCTQGGYHTNGTTQRSLTIEKKFEDLTNEFAVYTGMTCGGLSLTVPADGEITGVTNWMGKQEASATSTVGDGSNVAASSNLTMDGIDGPVVFYSNDVVTTFMEMSFAITNNLRGRQNAGDAYKSSIGVGSFVVTGSYKAYFESATDCDLYLAGTTSSVMIALTDGTNTIVVDMPAIRLTSAQRVSGGKDQDVVMEIGFEAYEHPTLGHTFRWCTF